MEISVLVPYAPAGPERERAWAWNRRRLEAILHGADAEIVTAAPDLVGDPGRFCRALALNRAAARARGDVLVIYDADTTTLPRQLGRALRVADAGGWTLPLRYVRLNEHTSDRWMNREPISGPPPDWERHLEQEYPFANSGVVALHREVFEAAGGFDERFTGWGGEDDGFRAAAETLVGPPVRVGIAFHLWHPRPPEHSTAAPNQAAQRVLADRYGAASGDREAMHDLIGERALGSAA